MTTTTSAVNNKTYTRNKPTMTFSLPSDITTLIDSLSITVGINKSLVVERIFGLVLEKASMDEIIEVLVGKK